MLVWSGKVMKVTEPWGGPKDKRTCEAQPKTSPLLTRGVIFGYREDLSEQELAAELKVKNKRYLTTTDSIGSIERTGAVVVTFKYAVPENIQIGFLRF